MTNSDDKPFNDLNQLLDLSRAMVATNDLNDLLKLIVSRSLALLQVERATVFLYDQPANELVAQIATGVDALRVPADKGICGQTVQTVQTIVVPDAYADPRFNPQVDKDTGFHTRNIMSIPLVDYEGQLVGVLQVLNKTDGDFSNYDVNLAEALGAQAGVVIQRASLIEHYLEKKNMERAMQIARDIQQSLLPAKPPELTGYDIAGLTDPADETGGDMYDFIPLPNGHWAFVVADATGHGIGPALVIAETRAMLRASTHLSSPDATSVSHILETVNHLLSHDLGGASFVTCFLGILDPNNHVLTYASAGHGPLLFYRAAEKVFASEAATGLPLGVLPDSQYDVTKTFPLDKGNMAFIMTDGIHEAMNPHGIQYGMERLEEQLRQCMSNPSQNLLQDIRKTLHAFTAGQQDDDITAVVIKR